MSRPVSQRIYASVFSKWPKQELRPDYQFQEAVQEAVQERFKHYKPSMEPEEVLRARALQFLVQDKFMNRYRLGDKMLKPKSQPTYFEDLVREIEEAPKRSWFERLGKRLSGMIRLQ
ncbi:hypothetical protein LIA77_03575 [Sarocladium implicatum]|nr:hypothetical protein LIA77_03575 [Sarocladium implicatum]